MANDCHVLIIFHGRRRDFILSRNVIPRHIVEANTRQGYGHESQACRGFLEEVVEARETPLNPERVIGNTYQKATCSSKAFVSCCVYLYNIAPRGSSINHNTVGKNPNYKILQTKLLILDDLEIRKGDHFRIPLPGAYNLEECPSMLKCILRLVRKQWSKYVPQNAAGNNNGNVRTNPQSNNNMFRQTPSSPAPRNRFMPNTMFPSTVQSVVLQQFPYAARQPQYPQFSYAGHQYYQQNSYYSFYPLQQPPQHQRTATLSVNSGVSVGVGSGISGAVAGPTTANQAQITLSVPPVANAVLGVTNATPTQPVGVNTLVSVMQSPQPTTRKIRRHALEIIDPNTNRNILEDLKSEKLTHMATSSTKLNEVQLDN
uniref:Uncharacterized protein n=1 Tax=Glossina austeni TaxID=7395 RepID=A0A1A9V1R7_GLOAU